MGMNFNVDVDIKTHGKEKIDQLEQQINKLKSQSIDINVKLTGNNKINLNDFLNTKEIQQQAQTVGQQVQKALLNPTIKSSKFNSDSFLKKYIQSQKADLKEASDVSKKYDTSRKTALQAVRARNTAQKKEESLQLKEQERLYKEQQRIHQEDLKQIAKYENAKSKINAQQQIAIMKQNAINKNAHHNELVSQGKSNLEKWRKEYQDVSSLQEKINSASKKLETAQAYDLNKYNGANGAVKLSDSLQKAADAKKRLDAEMAKGKNANISNINSDLKIMTSELKKADTQWDRLNASANALDNIKSGNSTLTWLKNNTKATKEYGEVLTKLAEQQKNAATVGEREAYTKQAQSIMSEATSKGLVGKSFLDEAKRATSQIAQFTGIYGALQSVMQDLPRQIVSSVYDVDTAMTNLYKVTDETSAKYNDFLNSAGEKSKSLGRDMASYIEQTSEWAKLGYSLDQSAELSKVSSIYANVGEVDDATAVSDIVTAMKAFNIEASDSMSIIDSLNKLGNEFATSSAALGEGLSKSASAMHTAGTDIHKTLAMLTGGAEITQNAGEFGNFLKVASMRIRGMKGKLEELGEEVDDSVDSISKVQTQILNLTHGKVNIFGDDNQFRDYYDIMEEIAAIHDDLSSTEQASLDEILFGKQRGNQGAALIQAFQSGQVQKAYQASLNSEGSAMEEQERWMDSMEAKIQQFKSTFQDFSNTLVSSDFLKGFIDTGTGALSVITSLIDNFGTLNTLIGVAGGAFASKTGLGKHFVVVCDAPLYKVA